MKRALAIALAASLFLGAFPPTVGNDGHAVPSWPLPGNTYVIDGDWWVNATQSYFHSAFYVSGNVTVGAGVSLYLYNTTVHMNSSSDSVRHISVKGALYLHDYDGSPETPGDSSRISRNDTSFGYTMSVPQGGRLDVRNSAISGVWTGNGADGLQATEAVVSITNSTLSDSTTGLRCMLCSANLYNVTITNCSVGLRLQQTNAYVRALGVSGCPTGLGIFSSTPDMDGVVIDGTSYGIYASNCAPSIFRATVTNAAVASLYAIYASPGLHDSVLSGATDVSAIGDSYPCLVNTSFNHSRVSVDQCAYVSVGQYASARVVSDDTGLPVEGLRVSVLDSEMAPASEGESGAGGVAAGLVCRSSMIFNTGEEPRTPVRAYAYGLSGGLALTGLNVSDALPELEVRVAERPDWDYFDGDTYLSSGDALYENATIVTRGGIYLQGGFNLTLRNSTMLFAPPAGRTVGLYAESGTLAIEGSLLSSAGASRPLTPVSYAVTVGQSSSAYLSSPDIRWPRDVMLYPLSTDWNGGSVSFASQNGVSAGMYTFFNITGAKFRYCKTAINAYYCTMQAENVTVDRSISAGVLISGGEGALRGAAVGNSSYGIYAYDSAWSASDSAVAGCPYGVYTAFGSARLERVSAGAAAFALYAYGGEVYALDSSLSSGYTGAYTGRCNAFLERCDVSGACAVYADASSPVLSNGTVSGGTHFYATARAFPTALNTTFSDASVAVSESSYLAVGGWALVQAFDGAHEPLAGAPAFAFDSLGNPVDERVCNGPAWMSFRDRLITSEGPVSARPTTVRGFYRGPEFLAGSAAENLSNGDFVELVMTNDSADWWGGGLYVDAVVSIRDRTVYTDGNVTVVEGGDLRLGNSSMFLAPLDGPEISVTVSGGSLALEGSALSACGAYLPGCPKRFSFLAANGAMASVRGSSLYAPQSVGADGSSLSLTDSSVRWPGGAAVSISSSSADVSNSSIDWCEDGIYADGGSALAIEGMAARHAGGACLNAYDSTVFASGIDAARAGTGARLTQCEGALNDSDVGPCSNGVELVRSSLSVRGLSAHGNSNAGVYISDCYPGLDGCNLSFNGIGAALSVAGPVIEGASFWGNGCGIRSYGSGPLVANCTFGGNGYGACFSGSMHGVEVTAFSTGTDVLRGTFIGGGQWSDGGLSYPARARLVNLSVDVEGALLKNVPVTYDDAPQLKPCLWEDILVWMDKRGGTWDIYMYDLAMDSDGDGVPNYMEWPRRNDDPALSVLTDAPGSQYNPSVWGDIVAWTDLSSGLSKVCLYSISNGTEWRVSDDPAQQEWDPCVGKGHVVWSCDDAGDADIWALSLANSTYYPFYRNPDGDDLTADVWGDAVVWWNFSSQGPWSPIYADIWKGDLSSGEAKGITPLPDGALQHLPSVSERWVAWQDDRNGDTNGDGFAEWDIYAMERATGCEVRVTGDGISHFAPELWEDLAAWYSVDYSTGNWGVHLQNISSGEHTLIEENANLDGRPVVWGPRVAFANMSRGVADIYVYDSRYLGYPSDASFDLGADGTAEFCAPGTYEGTTRVGGPGLVAEALAHASADGPFAYVPVRLSSTSTGAVIAGNLSLVFDLDATVSRCTFSGSTYNGIYCDGAFLSMDNTSLAGEAAPARLGGASEVAAANCTLGAAAPAFDDDVSSLTAYSFLHATVVGPLGERVPGAELRAVDNANGTYDGNYTTDSNGCANWTMLRTSRWDASGMTGYSPYALEAAKAGYERGTASADPGASAYVTITLGGMLPPVHSDESPSVSGYAFNTTPVIGVRVTDVSGVVESSISFYVNGYKVFRALEPAEGGYFVSYWHEGGFSEGQTVRCRIVASDPLGNVLDFTWNFTVLCSWSMALSPGWNLISLPLEQANLSLEMALGPASGRWDRLMWYDATDPANPWKQYCAWWAPALNGMPPLNHTMGFWLNATSNITLTAHGLWASSTSIPLHTGWNMVGYPTRNGTMTAANALWGTAADIVEAFDPTAPYKTRVVGPNYVLRPGEGYWIHVTTDSTWVVDW